MKPSIFRFAELYLAKGGQGKEEVIEAALTNKTPVQVGEYLWIITDAMTVGYDDKSFRTGHLVKFHYRARGEFVNLEKQVIEIKSTEYIVKAKSRFFFHTDSGIMCYKTAGSEIDLDKFGRVFSEIVTRSTTDGVFVNAHVTPISRGHDVLNLIGKFSRIDRVTMSIHPSNPSTSDIWEELDKRLREMNAKKSTEVILANKDDDDGLNVEGDKEITSKIHMASDGYGETTIRGTMNGEGREISTAKAPIRSTTNRDDDRPREMIMDLYGTFMEIWSTNENDKKNSQSDNPGD